MNFLRTKFPDIVDRIERVGTAILFELGYNLIVAIQFRIVATLLLGER